MKKSALTIAVISLFVSSCYNDSEESLFPLSYIDAQPCDTSIFTYKDAIRPMIEQSCISCHTSSTTKLSTYEQVKANADKILGSISHTSGMSMPQGAPKLENCKITQFKKWMTNGKLND